ncbi:MAG: hypothetical protein QOF58_817 [Pseudonocardiales bacterium]|jgi:hypothetical protein|nr:hypothetical protein [Pseudonocardiales bacterium]
MTTIPDPTAVETTSRSVAEIEAYANLLRESRDVAQAAEDTSEPTAEAVLPVIRHLVRGRYHSGGVGFQLELRVDVDGRRPMRRVSGDFFQVSGGTTNYFGSFIVHAPSIVVTATQIKIEGLGVYTWAAAAPLVRVTIPRVPTHLPHAAATVQFVRPPNSPGASYVCPFVSAAFRSIDWELDCVPGAVAFQSYQTGSLPQPAGSQARTLTVPETYAEGGLELRPAGVSNIVPVAGSGGNGWNDAELHNAMVNHFSLFANKPQWKVWTFVAGSYEGGGVRGIMFDYQNAFQRQGCAVFHDAIQGNDAFSLRAALRTYVHELGHAFNLLHSWQKNLATPPAPLGPSSGFGDLSWMNYPQNYQPGGTAGYWAAFPFQFTDNELIHLRHGFYKNVVMGANSFGIGAADLDPELFDEPIVDESGLTFEVRTRNETFEYGEPVVIELKLSTTDLRGRRTHDHLHPKDGLVTVAIRQPSGRTIAYRPFLQRCVEIEELVELNDERRSIYDSAYIGFGRDGFYFEQPGVYLVRAQYIAADGSRVVAPVRRITVRTPLSAADQRVGELLLGEQQGQLLALLGSQSGSLSEGNTKLDELLAEYPGHPLAAYAKLAKGVDAEHEFKDVTADKHLMVLPPRPEESVRLLTEVVDMSVADGRIDNITLNMAVSKLAGAHVQLGERDQAAALLDRTPDLFADRGVTNPKVLDDIRQRAAARKSELLDQQQ